MPNKTLPYFLMEKLSVFASIRETRCVPEAEQWKMVVLLRDAIYTTDSLDFYFYNNSFPSGGDSSLSWQSYCIMNDFPFMEVKCPVEGAPGLMCMTKGSLQAEKIWRRKSSASVFDLLKPRKQSNLFTSKEGFRAGVKTQEEPPPRKWRRCGSGWNHPGMVGGVTGPR